MELYQYIVVGLGTVVISVGIMSAIYDGLYNVANQISRFNDIVEKFIKEDEN